MKKIAIITRHAISNYGSLLQTIATQDVIEELGYKAEVIDYIRSDEHYKTHEKTLLKRKGKWNKNIFTRSLYLMLRQPESILAGKRFEAAQKKYLKLSSRYSTCEELQNKIPDADIYMTGSDQVWGPVEDGSYDSAYCLSFVPDEKKKIAYAASFGRTEMGEETRGFFKKWLSRYSSLAVREDSAVETIEYLGLMAKQVLDPTLLYDEEYWNKYLQPISENKYVLVYQLHNDERVGKYAKQVAKCLGLPLIRVSASLHQCSREGRFVFCPDMGKFLSYVKNAECMITDSFHGTAFAINFNTTFVEVLPNNKTGSRNVSILNLTGLSDRILKDDADVELATKKIDFTYANTVLKEKRIESRNVLRDMIEAE